MFWGGLVLLGLVAPFAIEGYPVFITRKVATSYNVYGGERHR